MCIFNEEVDEVKNTKILVGRILDGRQITVYANEVAMEPEDLWSEDSLGQGSKPNAMILPVPFNGTGKIDLLDLTSQSELFAGCEAAYPSVQRYEEYDDYDCLEECNSHGATLEVHQVGSYSISIAESLADLRRLDTTVFKVAANVDVILGKHYSQGFGFIICKFNQGGKKHPIGYIHPLLDEKEGTMFVPTLHEHGGEEEAKSADWDHQIYSLCCTDASGPTPKESYRTLEATLGKKDVIIPGVPFSKPYSSLRMHVQGLPEQFVLRRLTRKGNLPNEDIFFKSLPPTNLDGDDVEDDAAEPEILARPSLGRGNATQTGEKEAPMKKKEEKCTLN